MPTPLPAAIYARVSTEDQDRGDRYSISTQLADCRKLALARGAIVVAEHVDAERYRDASGQSVEPSARRSDRPGWLALLADLHTGLARAVIALDASRLYGDYEPAAQFTAAIERAGADVFLVTEPWHPDYAMFPAMSRRQWYRQHQWRYQAGVKGRVERGLHPTGRLPAFWATDRDERGRAVGYHIRPEYRAFLDELARLFLARTSYLDMAALLGQHPVTGGQLWPGNIRLWMTNRIFTGWIDYGRRVGKSHLTMRGIHEPAWDAETCAAVDAERERRAIIGRKTPHQGKFLFSGIARCGICGALMSGGANHGAPGYLCSRAPLISAGVRPGPEHRNYIPQRRLMALVRGLVGALTTADAAAFLAALAPMRDDAPADNSARLAALSAEADALRADIAQSSARGKAALAGELRRVETELDALRLRVARAPSARPDGAGDVSAVLLDLIAHPETLDLPESELRPLILDAFPALYIAAGELVPPPVLDS